MRILALAPPLAAACIIDALPTAAVWALVALLAVWAAAALLIIRRLDRRAEDDYRAACDEARALEDRP
jgi:uncharacterized protein (DUF2062 family)